MLRQLSPPGEAIIPSPVAGLASGQIIIHAVLGSCIVEGLRMGDRVAVGTPITVRHTKGRVFELSSASATVFAAGADVHVVDDDGDLAVVAATGDSSKVGVALFAKTSGQTTVTVVHTA